MDIHKTMYHREIHADSNMLKLVKMSHNGRYWLVLASIGILLEATALVYQYALDYPPCVVCIHVRIGVLVLILLSLAGFFLRTFTLLSSLIHTLIAVTAGVLLERSWVLLGTERGFIVGSCDFNLGLPSWLALDDWLPSVFEVQASCGYTPEILLGITMAETLLLISALLMLINLVQAGARLKHRRNT